MFASFLAPRLARRGVHYGWVVLAITFLVMLTTSASLGLPGVMLLPLQGEYGWGLGTISGALALRLVLYGVLAPFAAALMMRFGVRSTVVVALVLIVAGLLLATGMTAPWMLWASWGVILGIGSGLTAMVLGATVANRWFTARRGLVLGMLTASAATGQLAVLPLAAWLAEQYGWRMAVVPGVAGCAIAGVALLLFGADHPADLGLLPYGETPVPGIRPVRAAATANPVQAALAAVAGAARTRVFWILFGSFFICGLSTNGLMQTHFIPLCHDFGMGELEAASVLAMMGAFDFIGTILSGWLSDRYDNRWLLFWYYGLRGLSLMALPYSTFSIYGLSLFAMFYGLDWIATTPPTVKLAAQEFGRDQAPLIFGWVFTGHQFGAATAALLAGLSRDALSSYLPAFYAAGVACLIAALAVLFVRPGRSRSALAAAE